MTLGDGEQGMVLGRRRSLALGIMWMLAGAAWLTSAIILWVDRGQVTWWEVPAGAACLWVGSLITRQRVVLDRHGLETVSARGPERFLWASVASVEISDSWMRPALHVRRKGGAEPRAIPVTSGLRGSQRMALFDALVGLGREHGFDVRRDGQVVVAGVRDEASDDDIAGAEPLRGVSDAPVLTGLAILGDEPGPKWGGQGMAAAVDDEGEPGEDADVDVVADGDGGDSEPSGTDAPDAAEGVLDDGSDAPDQAVATAASGEAPALVAGDEDRGRPLFGVAQGSSGDDPDEGATDDPA